MYNSIHKKHLHKAYNSMPFSYTNPILSHNYHAEPKHYNSSNLYTQTQNNQYIGCPTINSKKLNNSNDSNTSTKYIESPPKNPNNDNFIFEIWGLKIYFDDLLIICILLFLYQEGIKDEYLFIGLILLLLS